MVLKGLRRWLGIGALAVGMLMPRESLSDSLEVINTDGISGNGIGGSSFYAQHLFGSVEGTDSYDITWTEFNNNFPNLDPKWLKIHTEPTGIELQTDARPTNSETLFQGKLSVVDTIGSRVSVTNKLRFRFPGTEDSDPNRIYVAKVWCDSNYTPNAQEFNCVTNIRDVIKGGGYLNLPGITNVPDGTVYGTLDVSCKFLDTNTTNHAITNFLFNASNNTVTLESKVQSGAYINDEVFASTNLVNGSWTNLFSTNLYVNPDSTNFNGYKSLRREVNVSNLGDSAYFRLHRKANTTNFFSGGYGILKAKQTLPTKSTRIRRR